MALECSPSHADPFRPPGARLARRLGQEGLRIEVMIIVRFLVMTWKLRSGWPGSDTMPALCPPVVSRIGHFGIGQQMNLVDRTPRRDVVRFRADGEDRRADVGERDWPARDDEAPLGQIVVRETAARRYSECIR